jgi:hypothetical protein
MSQGPSGSSVHGGLLSSRGGVLIGAVPFGRSSRWELTAMEGKGRGEDAWGGTGAELARR